MLARETDLIVLDEPTTFLDIARQPEVLGLLKHLHEADPLRLFIAAVGPAGPST